MSVQKKKKLGILITVSYCLKNHFFSLHFLNFSGSFYDDNWFSFENTGMLLYVENKVNEQPLKLEKEKSPIEKKGNFPLQYIVFANI